MGNTTVFGADDDGFWGAPGGDPRVMGICEAVEGLGGVMGGFWSLAGILVTLVMKMKELLADDECR